MGQNTKIKICGLKRLEDVDYANKVKPDLIGFIFATGRKRTITIQEAVILKSKLNLDIKAVGVFLNQEIEVIIEAVKAQAIDMIQLHGAEDDAYIECLRKELQKLNLEQIPYIIKAASIKTKDDIEKAVEVKADLLLLDNHVPGSGESFDWSWLKEVKRKYILAGGLSVDNVAEALKMNPYGVDVSSGVETDGVKDYQKMKAFVEAVRK